MLNKQRIYVDRLNEANLILKRRSMSQIRKSTLEARRSQKISWRVDAESLSQNDKELKAIRKPFGQNVLTILVISKDDILTSKNVSWTQRAKSQIGLTSTLMRVNNSWKSLNARKVEELERVAALSQGEARDAYFTKSDGRQHKEIASRIAMLNRSEERFW